MQNQSLQYYISKRGQATLAKKHNARDISQCLSKVVQISSKVKAMFLFQATEFCNGSHDRMNVLDFIKIRASILKKCQEIQKTNK